MYYILKKVHLEDLRKRGSRWRLRIWTDEIDRNFRRIYIRCINSSCHKIIEINDRPGSLQHLITINMVGKITPCVICPHCSCHLFVQLMGYEPFPGTPDVFTPTIKRAF